jgi:formiminotetrahydrofolate cyclodeaminase
MSAAGTEVGSYVEDLGAGCAAAITGALAAGAAGLAARVSGDAGAAQQLRELGRRLVSLADEDSAAYGEFMRSRTDEARRRTIEVPLAIAAAAGEVRELAAGLVERGKRSVAGDAEAAVELASAAARIGERLADLNRQ